MHDIQSASNPMFDASTHWHPTSSWNLAIPPTKFLNQPPDPSDRSENRREYNQKIQTEPDQPSVAEEIPISKNQAAEVRPRTYKPANGSPERYRCYNKRLNGRSHVLLFSRFIQKEYLVELTGIEPVASWLQTRRSPSWATAPFPVTSFQ
jgi:hypothetical protein